MDNNINQETVEVPKKVKTITGRDKKDVENKISDFKKDHFVSHEKWCTDKMALIFYWED